MHRVHLLAKAVARERSIVQRLVIEEGDDNGAYTNLNFETTDLKILWDLIQKNLYKDEKIGIELTRSSIVTCEGEDGWNDYLLLHHFDLSVKTDSLHDHRGNHLDV